MITAGISTCRHQSHCCGPIQDESTFRWPSCHIAQLVAFTCTQGRRYLLVLTRLRIATDPGDSLHFLGIIDKGIHTPQAPHSPHQLSGCAGALSLPGSASIPSDGKTDLHSPTATTRETIAFGPCGAILCQQQRRDIPHPVV